MLMNNRRKPDHYARRAKREGFAARSVYKLEEIDRKHRLFRRGMRVLDLGCAPGSWLKYAADRVGSKGGVVGIDRRAVENYGPHVKTLVGDIFETDPNDLSRLAGGPFDLVMSDMAPDTCGDRFTDHVRSVALCRQALGVAQLTSNENADFLCKVFEGPDLVEFVFELKGLFGAVKRQKPKSTRASSVELFLICKGRKSGQNA